MIIKLCSIQFTIFLFALTSFSISLIYCSNWSVVDLMPNRGYRLHWKLIDNSESVQFKVEVKSRGYFALGVSKTGTMANSDLVSGYVHLNGSAILHDRFASAQKMPEIVEKPNWELISGIRNETHLTFEFKRKCAIEDASVDVPIGKGLTHIVYATGKVDPANRLRIKYHGPKSRGSKDIQFLA